MKKDDGSSFQTVWKVGRGSARADSACAGGARALPALPAVADSEITLHTRGNFTIDWGDGCVEHVKHGQKLLTPGNTNKLKHVYVKEGEYVVSISTGVTEFWIGDESTKQLIEIKQWGAAKWEGMTHMFVSAINMVCTATDTPDTSKVENMEHMFRGCHKFNSSVEHWDTSCVTNMNSMLSHALMFNQPLAKMDLKAIKQNRGMLEYTPAFNQDLRGLNIGAEGDTDDLFGEDKSLARYNEEHEERYEAQDEKQDVYSVLDGAGACRVL